MDRRAFLTGLFGAGVVATLPATVIALSKPITLDWQEAITKIWLRHFEDLIFYGTAAIMPCDEFPYIKNVELKELYLPPATGGLFG